MDRNRKFTKLKLNDVFNPNKPVDSEKIFVGREMEINRLLHMISSPGRQVLIRGSKGIGKTSLALIIGNLFTKIKNNYKFYYSCEFQTTSEDIFLGFLEFVMKNKRFSKFKEIIKDDYIPFLQSSKMKAEKYSSFHFKELLDIFRGEKILLIIDDIDRIIQESELEKFAYILKYFSDVYSRTFSLLLVSSPKQYSFFSFHRSLMRSLYTFDLPPMNSREIKEMITFESKKIGMKFKGQSINYIESISQGNPYLAKLLVKIATEFVVSNNRSIVSLLDFESSLKRLKDLYESKLNFLIKKARDSRIRHADEILTTAASISKDRKFNTNDIYYTLKHYLYINIDNNRLNKYLIELARNFPDAPFKQGREDNTMCFKDDGFIDYLRLLKLERGVDIDWKKKE